MKNWLKKFAFICINIFLSACYLQLALILVIASFFASKLTEHYNDGNFLLLTSIFVLTQLPIIWILKSQAIQLIYKTDKSDIFKLLQTFISNPKYRSNVYKITAYLDIAIIILFYFISILGFHSVKNYLITTAILTIIFGGNLTTSYWVFYIQNKDNI